MIKRVFLTGFVLIVALGILSGATATLAGPIMWQIGTRDGNVNPILGASEYPATGAFTESFHYYLGTDLDPINSPSIPGYLGTQNVGDIALDSRPPTDTSRELNIHFALARDYLAGELFLLYGRYGSENDVLSLDGNSILTVDYGIENGFLELGFDLGPLAGGDHTITLAYNGEGTANGHYIDYIQLEDPPVDAVPTPEPSTMLLIGTGLVGFAGFRRKRKK